MLFSDNVLGIDLKGHGAKPFGVGKHYINILMLRVQVLLIQKHNLTPREVQF